MEKFVRFLAYAASLLVLAGFAAFAVDRLGSASKRTQDELAGISAPAPTQRQEQTRERRHTRVREWVDDANDVLLTPVAWVADGSGNAWVRRGVPTLLALLLYGFGFGAAARFSHGSAGTRPVRPTAT